MKKNLTATGKLANRRHLVTFAYMYVCVSVYVCIMHTLPCDIEIKMSIQHQMQSTINSMD